MSARFLVWCICIANAVSMASGFCFYNELDEKLWVRRSDASTLNERYWAIINPGKESCCHYSNRDCTLGTAEGVTKFKFSLGDHWGPEKWLYPICGGCAAIAKRDEFKRPILEIYNLDGNVQVRHLLQNNVDIFHRHSDEIALPYNGAAKISQSLRCPCGVNSCSTSLSVSHAATVTVSGGVSVDLGPWLKINAGVSIGTTRTFTAQKTFNIDPGIEGHATFQPYIRFIDMSVTPAYRPDEMKRIFVLIPQALCDGTLDGEVSFEITSKQACT